MNDDPDTPGTTFGPGVWRTHPPVSPPLHPLIVRVRDEASPRDLAIMRDGSHFEALNVNALLGIAVDEGGTIVIHDLPDVGRAFTLGYLGVGATLLTNDGKVLYVLALSDGNDNTSRVNLTIMFPKEVWNAMVEEFLVAEEKMVV